MVDRADKKKHVIKAGLGYTVANYFVKGLAFLTIPIFARILSTEDYGLYNTYLAYESVLSAFVGLALHVSLKNAKYKFESQYQTYVSSITVLLIASLIAWEIIGAVLFPLYKDVVGFPRYIIAALILQCFCTTVLYLYNVHLSLSYSYKKYLLAAAANAIGNCLLSVLLILTGFKDQRYIGRILGTIIPLLVISICIIGYFWRRSKPSINKAYWKFGLKFSVPLIPHAVSQVILSQFDRIMIRNMVGVAEAGIYSFAYNIYLVIETTKISLDSVWGTWFFEKYHNNEYKTIRKVCTMYILAMFCFSTVVMLISPELIYLLGTNKYFDSKFLVIPITSAGFYSFLYSISAQVEYYHEKTHFISISTTVAAVINIVLNAIFIKKYGYIAAAYTTEFTYMLYFALHYIIARKLGKGPIFDGKVFFAVSIGCFAISIIGVASINLWLLRWVMALLAVCGMITVVVKSGFLSKYLQKRTVKG